MPKVATNKKMDAIESRLDKLRRELLQNEEEGREYRESNRCYFFRPYKWQKRFQDIVGKKSIALAPSPNKIGKTANSVNIVHSWALGFEPWNEVDRDFPGAVEERGKFYKPSSLGIKPPVKIRITGEDWKYHLGQVIVPELKKWAPRGEYETKKNEQGIEYLWTWKNGSTFELMTYTQDISLSESWMGDGWWADEPPPQPMFGAMSRGLFLRGGKVFISMTPLKEAWILDELILSGRADIGVIDDLTILDNEDLYADECSKLGEMGIPVAGMAEYFDLLLYKDKAKRIFVEDKGRGARKYLENQVSDEDFDKISELKLLRFVQDTDPELASVRFGGQFKALVGRVLKEFRRDKHSVEPFPIPTDCPVIAMIDLHLSKPHAISYHTVNPHQMKFICGEKYENMTTEELADSIIRFKSAGGLRLEDAYIDPLSKGDQHYMKNRMGDELRDSFSIIEERLAEHDITLQVASKDRDSGIRNIRKALDEPGGVPSYYIFNTCKRHLSEVMRWVYDDNGKPKKGAKDDFDDMMENWYRATLTELMYAPPDDGLSSVGASSPRSSGWQSS